MRLNEYLSVLLYNCRVSIQEVGQRIKGFALGERAALSILLVLVAAASFMLGRLSSDGSGRNVVGDTKAALVVSTTLPPQVVSNEVATTSKEVGVAGESSAKVQGAYVASRKGTKYHLPWCSGARTISEENKLWFTTKEEAEAAGFTPAKNCKGL